jgi:hypothetical protein
MIAILGVGALGSIVAELLVRAGVTRLTLVDDDVLTAGNICRHSATLAEVGSGKVDVVARRLVQISPHARIVQHGERIPSSPDVLVDLLDSSGIIVDCTGSNDALEMLARAWWPIPRLFLSASVGYAARRFFSFVAFGNQFPIGVFGSMMRPWLAEESAAWAAHGEFLEGAGCWSPLFPARYDDILLAASACVKKIEKIAVKLPVVPLLDVFEQVTDDLGLRSFARVDPHRCDGRSVP